MKPYFLALSCLLTCYSQAQRIHGYRANPAAWTAEENHRELMRLEHEVERVDVRWQKNNRGEDEFFCDNKTFSDYTVDIYFTEFLNLQADIALPSLGSPSTFTIPPGTRLLFTLRKSVIGQPSRFQYHHRTYKGCGNPKIDTGFTYLLPVAPGKETHISELRSIAQEYGGESLPKDWYDLSLHVQAGDTIYAARRGRVTNVREQTSLQDSGYTYSSEENYVEIEHNDCTFGKYSLFRDNAIFVKPGERVEAGQPIGIAGGDKYESGPQVRFCVFYHLQQDVLDQNGNSTGKTRSWAYVPLYFWTKDQGRTRLTNKSIYTSEHPEAVVTAEMTKKEARKWKEKHKNG